MAKRPSKITALGLLKNASGLTLTAFAKVLGMERRRVQSYILGDRELPPLSDLSTLEAYFGIDLASLRLKRPKMISGREVTPEVLKGWRTHGGLSPEAAAIACEQMMPTISSTITTLAADNRQKALLLLHRIQELVGAELKNTLFVDRVKNAVEKGSSFNTKERYESGSAMLEEALDLPTGHPRWGAFVKKMNRDIPVVIERMTTPAFGLPLDKVEVIHEKKKSVGFRSTLIHKNTIVITQGGKSHRFSLDKIQQKVSVVAE